MSKDPAPLLCRMELSPVMIVPSGSKPRTFGETSAARCTYLGDRRRILKGSISTRSGLSGVPCAHHRLSFEDLLGHDKCTMGRIDNGVADCWEAIATVVYGRVLGSLE